MSIERATDPDFISLLDEALSQPDGVKIGTNDADGLRRRLYILRKEHRPKYDGLMLRISPEDHNELWIMRKEGDG